MAAQQQFGRYHLLDLLGRGGMGEVYRAHDTVTERIVAIKLLPADLAGDAEFEHRFRREARTAAAINDPHVVPIHNYGEIDGRLYVDMRLIEGRDLGMLITSEGGRLNPDRAVTIIEQVAGALDSAHAAGLVHRDVKPSNVLVTDRDFAYLIDFGIARATADTAMTKTGHMIGTLAYMAPERFNGTTDPGADVYSLACVLYECLTGDRPYPGDSLEEQVAGHLTKPPPRPSVRCPDVPGALDAVIARGLAKDPKDRYRTASELARAARAALAGAARPNFAPNAPTQQAGFPPKPPTGEPRRQEANFRLKPELEARAALARRRRIQWVSGGAAAAAVAVIAVVVAVVVNQDGDISTPSASTRPSIAASGSTSSSLPHTASSSATTSATPGANRTVDDYFRDSKIKTTVVKRGEPGAPTIDLPVPPGWHLLPESAGAPSYGGIAYDNPADPNDAPTVVAIVTKLDGDVDAAKVFELAPGELKNLPGFEGGSPNGTESTLGVAPGETYKAWQFGGSYTKNDKKRTAAQKTVVITGPNGTYLLQLDADSLDAESGPLMDATSAIDEQTVITP